MISFDKIDEILNELRTLWQNNQDLSFSDLISRLNDEMNIHDIKEDDAALKLLCSLWSLEEYQEEEEDE